MKSNFQGSQKKPIRVTVSQKGLGKRFQKIHLFDHQFPKVNGVVTLFTVTNFRPVSTSLTHVGARFSRSQRKHAECTTDAAAFFPTRSNMTMYSIKLYRVGSASLFVSTLTSSSNGDGTFDRYSTTFLFFYFHVF